MADYDLVIASQPYRARASVEFKASKVVAPLAQRVAARRPAGRHPFAWATTRASRSSTTSGRAIIPSPPTATPSCGRSSRTRRPRRGTTISTPPPTPARSSAITCTRCRTRSGPDRHLDAVRRLERRDLRRAGRGPAAGGSGARRPLSRSHRPGAEEARRPLVQRRDLRDLAPPHERGQSQEACHDRNERRFAPRPRCAVVDGASVEISSRGHQVAELKENFGPGIDVTITSCPATTTATTSRRRPRCAGRVQSGPAYRRARNALARGARRFSRRARGARPASNRVLLIAGRYVARRAGPSNRASTSARAG